MSLVQKVAVPKLFIKNNPIFFAAVRNHWNKDYKPGPFPVTAEERNAAADKYGIPREEYQPYPDDGTGRGDYPKLPDISADSKDPFYPWDNPELKRNFNEPLHADFDLMREDRYDVSAKLRLPLWVLWAQFLGVMIATFGVYCIFEKIKMFPAVLPKQYPKDRVTHYTFEPK